MRRLLTILFFLAVSLSPIFAGGKKETPPVYSDKWVLCITETETTGLSPSKAAVGSLITRTMAEGLRPTNKRFRAQDAEFAYYRDIVWLAQLKDAAKKIEDKQKERDALVYQGSRASKFKRNTAKIDKELAVLREKFEEIQNNPIVIESNPSFSLLDDNLRGVFPAPPADGAEYNFCKKQKVDGFVTAKIVDYYDRILLTVRVYSLYLRGFSFEQRVIFPLEGVTEGLAEVIDYLVEDATQKTPAGLSIEAEPQNALILLGDRYAGTGTTDIITRNSGEAAIAVSAPGYDSYEGKVALEEGVLTRVKTTLPMLPLGALSLNALGAETAQVYQGALFVGTMPLGLTLPVESRPQLTIITESGKTAQGSPLVEQGAVSFRPTKIPPEDKVAKARKGFYSAWGRFWIALPVTLVLNGMFNSYVQAYSSKRDPTEDEYNTALNYQYAVVGAGVITGIFAAEFAVRLFYYVGVANRERTPLDKTNPPPVATPPIKAQLDNEAAEDSDNAAIETVTDVVN